MINLQKKAKGIFTKEYKVSNYADRMGYRVEGEILNRAVEKRFYRVRYIWDHSNSNGGQPIILMADRQTTGGYPRMGSIISVDLPLLAQLKPGDYVSFENITLEEAEQLYIEKK